MRFELSCLLRATREDVFAFLERDELGLGPHTTSSAALEAQVTAGRMRLWIPLRGPTNVTVTRVHRDPPARLAYRWTMGRRASGELEYVLCPDSIGTRLRHGVSMEPDGPFEIMRPFLRRALHAAAERRLRRLCQRLDGGLGADESSMVVSPTREVSSLRPLELEAVLEAFGPSSFAGHPLLHDGREGDSE